ncbi:Isoquinoline 1-oxidoreductase subunit [Flaviflagellibacter deserti]|uniref:Isoquinoline 1-oxidoreductase subunit n=1 Tax=Flaviflagellibacter deserti TaxID=2267266 RepID=A0ABV9Z2Q1_9HYPH
MNVRLLKVLVLAVASLGVGLATFSLGSSGIADTSQGTPDPARRLKSVSEFQSIADAGTRSRALFVEAAKVITDPRCINCHPMNRQPTQGDSMHPHVPLMNAGGGAGPGIGPDGLMCSACHRAENSPAIPGSRVGSVPGNAHWSLAPVSMGWQKQTLGYICRQLKDPTRNGNRSLTQIHRHTIEDHLVGWAWHPGEGRRPAPGTQEEFSALIGAWIETGAECPS